jgi:membrane-associated phospholipid phosphatase
MIRPAALWQAELKRRLAAAWLAKMLATTLGIGAFFVAYFWVLNYPQDAVTIMPLTGLDRLVPLDGRAMPLYLSLWAYVSIGPALLRDGRELARYGAATFILSAIGLAVFLLWPSSTPDFGIDWAQYPTMSFLKSVDVSANACPSLHVAFAAFSGIWIDRLLRDIGLGRLVRILNLLWCVGIVYSTLAVRQHVVLDVVAGAALGAAVALAHRGIGRWRGVFGDVWRRCRRCPRRRLEARAASSAAPFPTDPVAGRRRNG